MSTKTVVITGAPGFIGRRVVERFLSQGWSVVSLSLPGELPHPQWGGRVRMVYTDLTGPDDLGAVIGPFDLAIHLAAVVGLAGDYERQWSIIAEGTRNLCQAAAVYGARLVVVSSIAVYGDKIQTQTCREFDGFGAWQGAYGRAKQGQEVIALELAEQHGLALTVIRPANVYGLGGSSAWGERFIEGIRETGGACVGQSHVNNAGLVYVENLADALYLSAVHPDAPGKTFNVCDGEPISWRRFTDDMARLADKAPPPNWPLDEVRRLAEANEDPAALIGPRSPALPTLEGLNLIGYDNRIDASALRRTLGWTPRVPYEAAVAEMTAQWLGAAA